ncbi:MAG: hypothetical protein ACFFD1_14340 [Candidatus Thorarchaeota archaeon]
MGAKEFFGSVVVSVVLISALGYLALPIIYPNVQEDTGIVLQSKYITIATSAGITDDNNVTYAKVPNTELNITISDQSRIVAIFNSPYIIGVGPGVTNKRFAYNVSLNIEGIGSRVIRLASWYGGTTSYYNEIASTLYIDFSSSPLPAGTYTINVKWISLFKDSVNLSYLTFNAYNPPNVLANYSRSLWVMELR